MTDSGSQAQQRIRVFIAEDHAVVRRGLRQVLEESGDFEVVGEAATGREVLNAPGGAEWDAMVLDLSLPYVNGTEVLRRIKAQRPELPVVILSMFPEDQYAGRLLQSGAAAYLSKDRPPEDVVDALRAAVRGVAAAAPRESPEEVDEPLHARLSAREHQVFMLMILGSTVSEIAAELDLHVSTVSNHLTRLKAKLGVRTLAELVHYAHSVGLHPGMP